MPSSIIKSFAKNSGKSLKEVETLWQKAKDIAKEEGRDEEYDYIVGILKRMLKLNEVKSFSEFVKETLEKELEETTSSISIPNIPMPLGYQDLDQEDVEVILIPKRKLKEQI